MIFGIATAQEISVDDMKGHLENYERDASLLCNKQAKANWDVQTDVLNEEKVVVQVREKVKIIMLRFDA